MVEPNGPLVPVFVHPVVVPPSDRVIVPLPEVMLAVTLLVNVPLFCAVIGHDTPAANGCKKAGRPVRVQVVALLVAETEGMVSVTVLPLSVHLHPAVGEVAHPVRVAVNVPLFAWVSVDVD